MSATLQPVTARSLWPERFVRAMAHAVPDAITASVVLLLILAVAALSVGNSPIQVVDAYYRGLWMLLPFTMQMTLIIVLSSALACTPFFRGSVAALSRAPRTTTQMLAAATLLTAAAAYAYWGLGLALGPVIAVFFAREAERKGLKIDFPFFLAMIYAANAVWQYGLSATAPLLIATPGHFLQDTIGVVPLSRTIWSPASLIHLAAFTTALVLVGRWLLPRPARPISQFPDSLKVSDPLPADGLASDSFSQKLERKPWFTYLLSAVFLVWLWYHFRVRRLGLDINSLNTTLLLLTFLLHRNFRSFSLALERAVVSGWPVIVLYPLYAGLAGIIQYTDVGSRLAAAAAALSNSYTFPTLTAAIATVFSFFIPSSGGQWAIQGFVTVKSASAVGISIERGLLAMGIGDHMGNLTSPFWYAVVASIVRLDFRTFFGYGLIFAALWFGIGIVVFTFAPC
jgi:short-chain fatty acids transporter